MVGKRQRTITTARRCRGWRRGASSLGVLCLGVTLLAACGSSRSASSSAGAKGASPVKVTIALPVDEPVQSPVYLAEKLGFFAQHGVDAHVIVLPSDTADNAALLAGSVQYTSVNAVALVHANEKSVPLQDICTEYNGPAWALAVSQKVINRDHLISGMDVRQLFSDLHGQKVAIVGTAVSAPGLILTGLLKQNGLSPGSLTLVGVSSSPALGSAFSHGEVAAVFDTQPIPDRLVQQTPGQVIFDTTQLTALANVPWEGILSTRSYIASHPTADRAVCAAIGQADNFLLHHPSSAVKDLQSTFPSLTPGLLKDALMSYHWAPDGTMTASQWTTGVRLLAAFGFFKPPSAAVVQRIYSTAYLP